MQEHIRVYLHSKLSCSDLVELHLNWSRHNMYEHMYMYIYLHSELS